MKLIAIVGSPRARGNTNYLVDQALAEAATRGIEIEKIELGRYRVNPCLGHDNCASLSVCKQNDDAPWILDKFSKADGLILASPVYYFNMSAQMKAFVDRNYFLFRHKTPVRASCAGIIVIAETAGVEQAARTLVRFLKLATAVPDDRIITLTGRAGKLGAVKKNAALVEEARSLGMRLAEMLDSALIC